MKRLSAVALSALLAASTAPDAFGWGAYHGAYYGGTVYRGTAVVTPGYVAAPATATSAAYAAESTNYYPPPY
jgi:hypothetical protein